MILVTGGCGYLGSAIIMELLEKGYHIRLLDNADCSWKNSLELNKERRLRLDFLRGDITSENSLRKALHGVDSIIHLAAATNEALSFKHPERYFKINYEGSKKLCKVAGELGIEKIIYCSSCSVYGHSGEEFVSEETPPLPRSPYALSKLLGEQACLIYGSMSGISINSLRIPTLFGLSIVTRLDTLVNRIISKAIRKEKITIRGDGSQIRPILHVKDAARSFIFTLERDLPSGEIFNVVGENLRVNDIISLVEEFLGKINVRYSLEDMHPEIYSRPVSSTKFISCGFSTKLRLRDGIREFMNVHPASLINSTLK